MVEILVIFFFQFIQWLEYRMYTKIFFTHAKKYIQANNTYKYTIDETITNQIEH